MLREMRAILFADVVGYSRLPDLVIPQYKATFFDGVADLLDRQQVDVLARNTWGDAIHLVFSSLTEAADLSFLLRDWMKAIDWPEALGVDLDLNLRIALHAGPVFRVFDPVSKSDCFLGQHVNLAARIEPIATEGQIFTSEEFAALLAAEAPDRFVCEYQGVMKLPKKEKCVPVYRLRSRQVDMVPLFGVQTEPIKDLPHTLEK